MWYIKAYNIHASIANWMWKINGNTFHQNGPVLKIKRMKKERQKDWLAVFWSVRWKTTKKNKQALLSIEILPKTHTHTLRKLGIYFVYRMATYLPDIGLG